MGQCAAKRNATSDPLRQSFCFPLPSNDPMAAMAAIPAISQVVLLGIPAILIIESVFIRDKEFDLPLSRSPDHRC
jgi:hypothetical protein